MLRIEEVAIAVGVSVKTINNWYWYKREFPDAELAKMLPEYHQEYPTAPRYWDKKDVFALLEFKKRIPTGRNGVMGAVTQKYCKRKKEEENGNVDSGENTRTES